MGSKQKCDRPARGTGASRRPESCALGRVASRVESFETGAQQWRRTAELVKVEAEFYLPDEKSVVQLLEKRPTEELGADADQEDEGGGFIVDRMQKRMQYERVNIGLGDGVYKTGAAIVCV